MTLQEAATILVIALIPGTPPEPAVEQACDLLGGRYPLKNTAASQLAQQLIDLVVDGRIPKPVKVCRVRRDGQSPSYEIRIGPNTGFDVIGAVAEGTSVNLWRELLAWSLISFDVVDVDCEHKAGWIKNEHLRVCLEEGPDA